MISYPDPTLPPKMTERETTWNWLIIRRDRKCMKSRFCFLAAFANSLFCLYKTRVFHHPYSFPVLPAEVSVLLGRFFWVQLYLTFGVLEA